MSRNKLSRDEIAARNARWDANERARLADPVRVAAETARREARKADDADEARWAPAVRLFNALVPATTEDLDEAIEIVLAKFGDVDGVHERLDTEAEKKDL